MKIMVSACLLGENCKYNGGSNYSEELAELLKGHEVVPVCPELLGGLPAPRPPVEIRDGVAVDKNGRVVEEEFRKGCAAALGLAARENIELAILQPRSPSCGVNEVYDGTFSGRKILGRGKFAAALTAAGYRVLDAADVLKNHEIPESEDKMTIYFVRHGESVGNAKGLLQGQSDYDLSDKGVAQAVERAKDFPQDFDVCVCSTLLRAKRTADILLPDMEKIYDRRIVEVGFGEWENTPITPEKTEQFLAGYIPPGGETPEEFEARIKGFLADVKARFPGKRVAVVTHGGVIQEVLKISGSPARIVNNLELTAIEV